MIFKAFPWLGCVVVAAALLAIPASARAQTANVASVPVNPAECVTCNLIEPSGVTAGDHAADKTVTNGEVQELKEKVTRLQSLVDQQQLSLTEMAKEMADLRARTAALALSSAPQPATAPAGTETPKDGTVAAKPEQSANGQSANPQDPQSLTVTAGLDANHPYLRSSSGNFVANVGGVAQLDFRGYSSGSNHPANTFLIRRARLYLEGRVFSYFDFRIEGDFADTSSTILRDAYVRVHRIEPLQLTFGQFKEPFSQEELKYDAYQSFVERSLVNNLVPSRSPGVMASGALWRGAFEYQLGAFNGKGLLAQNTSSTPETILRLRTTPWKNSGLSWIQGLSIGGAFANGRGDGGTSIRGLTESHSVSFFTPDPVNGKILRSNGELTWVLGPAILRAEYDETNQQREGLGPHGSDLPGVVAKGYLGQFTYLLTGEKKPDSGPVTPKHNVFGNEPGKTGWGAWELKVRYSNLQINDSTNKSNRADTIYFGPNWYLNRFVRYLIDMGFERFEDPLRTPHPGDRTFFVVLSRVQFAF